MGLVESLPLTKLFARSAFILIRPNEFYSGEYLGPDEI